VLVSMWLAGADTKVVTKAQILDRLVACFSADVAPVRCCEPMLTTNSMFTTSNVCFSGDDDWSRQLL
jgi:hypothetical protein